GERVPVHRRDDPGEPAALDPGGVEQLDVADAVGEDDPIAVPVEPVVNEGLNRPPAFGAGQGGSPADQARREARPRGGEMEEAAAPEGLVAERLRIETRSQLAAVAQSHADALGDRHAGAAEDAAQDAPEIRPVPAAVRPGRFVLVAPVALRPAVEARE